MSVKKLLVLTAAGLAAISASAVMAGGSDNMAMSSEPASQSSVYVDLDLGYAQSNWTDNNTNRVLGNSAVSSFTPSSNGKGGFSFGADLGYNINQNIAVEGGWYYLPKVKGTGTGVAVVGGTTAATASQTLTVNSGFAYLAAKLSVPVVDNVDLYGKVGAGFRYLTYDVPAGVSASISNVTGNGYYFAPVLGAGVQYTWNMNWLLGVQYLYFPGDSNVNNGSTSYGAPDAAPSVNLYTAFIGYKFNV